MAFDTEMMTDAEVKDEAVFDLAFDESYFTNYILIIHRNYVTDVNVWIV